MCCGKTHYFRLQKEHLISKRQECQALKLEMKSRDEKQKDEIYELKEQLKTLESADKKLENRVVTQKRVLAKQNEKCRNGNDSGTNTAAQKESR